LEIHWKNETFADKRKLIQEERMKCTTNGGPGNDKDMENFDEQQSNLEPTRTLESSERIGIHRKKGRNIVEPFDATMKDL
jgi:hypothetical protein